MDTSRQHVHLPIQRQSILGQGFVYLPASGEGQATKAVWVGIAEVGNVDSESLAEPVVGFHGAVGVGIFSNEVFPASVVHTGRSVKGLFVDPVMQLFSLYISTSGH